MKKKVWLLFVIVPVVLVALLLWIRSAAPPSPASGGTKASSKPGVDTEALMARVKAQSELAASAPVLDGNAPAATQPLLNEQEELRAINAYANAECQKIEKWYAEQTADMKTQLEQRVQTLSPKDQVAWAEYFQRAKEKWPTAGGRSATTTPSGVRDPSAEYGAMLALMKNSRQATKEDFLKAQVGLAWMKQDKLAAVQREVDRRKAILALQKPAAATPPARKPTAGAAPKVEPQPTIDPAPRVEAIMGGLGGKFQALIGDGLVSEGTVVQGYRVQKIYADRVEFEKDGKTWVQKVN